MSLRQSTWDLSDKMLMRRTSGERKKERKKEMGIATVSADNP